MPIILCGSSEQERVGSAGRDTTAKYVSVLLAHDRKAGVPGLVVQNTLPLAQETSKTGATHRPLRLPA